ncbi:MAG: 2-hydroxyacyl-CoA dehydratase, partial [Promethearchaeota archaeon]
MADSQNIEFYENLTKILRDMQSVFSFGVGKAIFLYFNKLLKQIRDPNKKKILSNIGICPEISYAMDLVPIQQELTSTLCAAIGTSVDHLDAAIEAGIPQGYLCNFQKVWIGAMISNKLPRPDILVYAPEPCDSMHENYQFIQNLYNIPAFGFDIPYWTHEKTSPYYDNSISKYVGNQVKKLVS